MTNVSIEAVPATTKKKRRGPLGEVLFRLRKSPLAMFGLVVILVLVFLALFAGVLAPYPYQKQHLSHMYE